jgi:hypothetical protein
MTTRSPFGRVLAVTSEPILAEEDARGLEVSRGCAVARGLCQERDQEEGRGEPETG